MARRTRRPKVVWLPLDLDNRLATAPLPATTGADNALSIQILPVAGGIGQTTVDVIGVVRDNPQNAAGAGQTLSDYEGSAYRLRRIVGKIFVTTPQDQDEITGNAPSRFAVTCGFIILKCDQGGVPLAPFVNYNIQALDATRDPWIWRRTWCIMNLGIGDRDVQILNTGTSFPRSNMEYGSVMDGPHVDAKTARVVSDEERLYFVTSVTSLDGALLTEAQVLIFTDIRVLASMKTSSGNRRNASR